MGNGIATNQLMKMVAGAINPGRPVANLYVSSHRTSEYEYNHPYRIHESSLCGAMMWSLPQSAWQGISR